MLDAVIGALSSKAAPVLASLGGSALSFLGGERRNDSQVQAANAQMEFQREMSGSAYQRAVADMKAAGINPMLAAKQGGASTPMGAMPQIQDTLTPAVQSGVSAYQGTSSANLAQEQELVAEATVDKIIEEIKNVPLEGERLFRAANLLYMQANLASQQQLTESQRYDNVKAATAKLLQETDLIGLDVEAARTLDNIGREAKQLQPIIEIMKSFIRR
jgi:hypothetical protein